MPQNNSYAKRWVFTLNNWNDAELTAILDSSDSYHYIVIGRERGDSGTPHLQGFFILQRRQRLTQVRRLPGLARAHFEVSRGTPQQASDYCKKDGDFEERGQLPEAPEGQGKRSDWERLVEWLTNQEVPPSTTDVMRAFPSLYGRYKNGVEEFVEQLGPRPVLVNGALRDWQGNLYERITQEADDRKVIFVVDPNGNSGKSYFCKYCLTHRDDTQVLKLGRRDDLALSIDRDKRVFLFDIPRQSLQYLQYSVLEMIKDRIVYSPKYQSVTKIMQHNSHVIVFTNEQPDMNRLTGDRYEIITI